MKHFIYQYRKILFFILILLLIIIIYLFFKSPNFDKPIVIDIEHKNVTFDNSLPISDTLGKKMVYSKEKKNIQGYVEISVFNPNDEKVPFSIVVTKNNIDEAQISDNYIKLYLSDDKDNPVKGFENNMVPVFSEFNYLSSKPASKLIYQSTLDQNSEKKYILRTWVSDTYAISSNIKKFSFKVEIVV